MKKTNGMDNFFSINSLDVSSGDSSNDRAPSWKDELRIAFDEKWQSLRTLGNQPRLHLSQGVTYILEDALNWLNNVSKNSMHAIVTDPPYSIVEYDEKNHSKLRGGRGGVWRIPPSWDGVKRNPIPRFTVLSREEVGVLRAFFEALGVAAMRALVPGGHVIIASNPLLSSMTFHSLQEAGLEKRGEIIRLVQTLRGGDRPKGAENEFPDVTVMARSCWEPWGVFRKPFSGTVAANLRQWGAGGLRRISDGEPFRDVIACAPTRSRERGIAPHPSLKPQRFLRQVVRASLPLGIGIVYDPFAGSASTLAAAEAIGYRGLGTERDASYYEMGCRAFAELARLQVSSPS